MKKIINTFFSLILLLLGGFLLVILTSFNRDKTDNKSKDFIGGLFIDSVKADVPGTTGSTTTGSTTESDSCEAAGAGAGAGASGGTEGCSI